MICGIYKIENLINGKIYIGQSTNIKKRLRVHRTNGNKLGYLMYREMLECGVENFSFEVLEECKPEKLNELEKFYIKKFKSFDNGYNLTEGGDGVLNRSIKLSRKEVLEILILLKYSSISQNEIAKLYNVGIDTISEINHGKTRYIEEINYPVRNRSKPKDKKQFFCKKCGKEIIGCGKTGLCLSCANVKVEKPTKEQLIKDLIQLSFARTAKKYSVTETCIRKWCKYYEMSTYCRDYK